MKIILGSYSRVPLLEIPLPEYKVKLSVLQSISQALVCRGRIAANYKTGELAGKTIEQGRNGQE